MINLIYYPLQLRYYVDTQLNKSTVSTKSKLINFDDCPNLNYTNQYVILTMLNSPLAIQIDSLLVIILKLSSDSGVFVTGGKV